MAEVFTLFPPSFYEARQAGYMSTPSLVTQEQFHFNTGTGAVEGEERQ